MSNTFDVWTPFSRSECDSHWVPACSGRFYASTCLNALRSALRKFGVKDRISGPARRSSAWPRAYLVGNDLWFVRPSAGNAASWRG